MKHSFIFSLIVLFSWVAMATANADNGNDRLIEANTKYTEEDYESAAAIYEEILQGGESAVIYYNLGNTYYKQGRLGPAILNYERALLHDPGNEDIQYNLEMTKNQTIDKFESVDRFFLLEWIDALRSLCNTNGWAYISIICFIITLILTGTYIFARIGWLKKVAFFSGIVLFIVTMVAFNFSGNQREKLIAHDHAIIFSPSVTVKSTPDESGTELFLLHEGTKVKIKRKLGNWIEIQLEDGNVGWISSTEAESI